MKQPNIIFFFPDQQRPDTIGCYGQKMEISPNLDKIAKEGVLFEEAYTAQPVCGPCRAIFQSGKWPTSTNCYRNGQALPLDIKTLADYFYEAGYETAYIGKWHLASERLSYSLPPVVDYEKTAIPPERRGGYRGFWRVADVLEETSHGYGGYVFNENMQKCSFTGYRADAMTDYAMEYLDTYKKEKPFFMTISYLEPHQQNDRACYEGPEGSKERFKDFTLPGDLEALGGDAKEMYPDYLGCCRSLDDNLGRIVAKLKELDLYDNTVIVYASDHGSHFKTRNKDEHMLGCDDYKRSCHSASLKVPLIISGPGFTGGKRVKELVSTSSLPKTFLAMAGVDVGDEMIGENLKNVVDGSDKERKNRIFAQISESRLGRCIRNEKYLYSVFAPGEDGWNKGSSDIYMEDFLYDIEKDPYELNNLVKDPAYTDIRKQLAAELIEEMKKAGEKEPKIIEYT